MGQKEMNNKTTIVNSTQMKAFANKKRDRKIRNTLHQREFQVALQCKC